MGGLGQDGFSPRDISSTFVKGMAVLKAFDDTHTRLTLAEITRLTGLDRASVRRLVLTLVHLGYAQKDGRHFSLTPKVLVLAGSFLRGNRFGTHVQPLLNRHAARLGSTISLAICDEDAAVYVAQSSGAGDAVSFGFTVGSRLPLLHTAIGRMMLAYGDPDWARTVMETAPVQPYTPDTALERGEIARRVAACRAQGHAVVAGEFEPGVTGFAVPVGGPGRAVAVVGTSRPIMALRDGVQPPDIIARLHQTALELAHAQVFPGG